MIGGSRDDDHRAGEPGRLDAGADAPRLGILASHPIQYQAPLYRELARLLDLTVFFAHRQSREAQADAGFGVAFDWDVDLHSGYRHEFLHNVARNPGVDRFSGCDTPDIARRIREKRFDAFLVMGWQLKCFWQAVWACRRAGVPVMVRGDSQLATPRSRAKQAVKELLYPRLVRQFDAGLYVGARNKAYLEHYGARPHRLFFSPHCVDGNAFAESAGRSDRDAVRAQWGLTGGDRAVLFAGKFLPRKRPMDLVLAIARLRADGAPVVAILAGDGPLRGELETTAKGLGAPLRCLGFRNQTELPAVYAAADALVLPSEGSETWGLVVNEALACGTPCVVSDACGCAPDMIVQNVTGSTFPMGNVASLTKTIARVLEIPRASPGLRAHVERYSPRAAANGVRDAAHALRKRR